MKILINSVNNENFLDNRFGKNAPNDYLIENLPLKNFEIQWKMENNNSKFLHLLFIDYDAIPVCGKPWIHWTVANIDLSKTNIIRESDSINNNELIQGISSLAFEPSISNEVKEKYGACYIGPMPPDKDHRYTLQLWTTKEPVKNIEKGFYFNQLYNELIETEIIESNILLIDYKH